MSKLIFVRHGETEKNTKGVLHDSFDQEMLNSKGRQQIKVTAAYLKQFNPMLIFSSKEKRAIESGEILSKELAIPFEKVGNLHERNWGKLSGKPWFDIKAILGPMTLEKRYNFVPQGGESWKTFETRLINAVKKIVTDNPNKSLAIVTHGGAIRALMPFLLGAHKEESFKHDPDNASVTVFEVLSPDRYKSITINNTDFLPEELKTVKSS